MCRLGKILVALRCVTTWHTFPSWFQDRFVKSLVAPRFQVPFESASQRLMTERRLSMLLSDTHRHGFLEGALGFTEMCIMGVLQKGSRVVARGRSLRRL